MDFFDSQIQNNTNAITHIVAVYLESTVSFKFGLNVLKSPSYMLHAMYIFYDDDYILMSYSKDYETEKFFLKLKDIEKEFTFKDDTQIFF